MRNISRKTVREPNTIGTASSIEIPVSLDNLNIFNDDSTTAVESLRITMSGPLADYRIIVGSDDSDLATQYTTIIECLRTAEEIPTSASGLLLYSHDDLASDAIDHSKLVSAVSSVWHDIMEPSATYEADGEARFDRAQLTSVSAADLPKHKKSRPVATKTSRARGPSRDLRDLQDRLISKKIALRDVEVLDVILAPVAGAQNSKLIAERLLIKFSTFGKVINAGPEALMTIEGLGREAALALTTVGAAALHMLRKAIDDGPRIRMQEELIKYVIARLQNERVEILFVIFLDTSLRVIADEELSRGSIDHTPGYPREVIRRCLELDATSCFLVHNHPSGVMKPSAGDIEFTKSVVNAAQAVGIVVQDHLIVGRGECFSFRHNKLIIQGLQPREQSI